MLSTSVLDLSLSRVGVGSIIELREKACKPGHTLYLSHLIYCLSMTYMILYTLTWLPQKDFPY